MTPEKQQQIIDYFLDEAKDYLAVIEQDFLNLQYAVADHKPIKVYCHPYHLLQRWAAMLQLSSIQILAQRLEAFWRAIGSGDRPLNIDATLQDQSRQVFYTLKELIERLGESSGLVEDQEDLLSDLQPTLAALNQHVNLLLS